MLQEYFMWVRMNLRGDDHGCAVGAVACIISCTRDGFESWGEFVAVKLISSIIASELEIQLVAGSLSFLLVKFNSLIESEKLSFGTK